MPRIAHILFPFDFSKQGALTAPIVRSMAARLNAKVTLYAVVPPTWDMPPEGMRPIAGEQPDEWKRSLQPRLDAALTQELGGIEVARVVDVGDPAMRIKAFVEDHGVDLVMMPTRGQGVFRSMLLGSVTSKVLHDVPCPVWTAAHTEASTAAETPRSMLCAVDISERTAGVCQYAADLSDALGATLRVVHAVAPLSDWITLESERQLQEHVRDSAEAALAATLAKARVAAPLDVVVGNVGAAVAEHARWQKAGLIVTGRGAINDAFGRLRAHNFDIIQRAGCPVISV